MRVLSLIVVLCAASAFAQESKRLAFDPEETIKEYLSENVNNPSQLSFVEFSKPVPSEKCLIFNRKDYGDDDDARKFSGGWWQPVKRGYVAMAVKYRATDNFGTKRIFGKIFMVDKRGILAVYEPKDVRIGRDGLLDEDPATAAFLKMAK